MHARLWIDDDPGYLDWIRQNPDGFVANVYHTLGPNYFVVHRATHHLIMGPFKGKKPNSYTGNIYAKVTARSPQDLWLWGLAQSMRTGPKTFCGTCFGAGAPQVEPRPAAVLEEVETSTRALLGAGAIRRPRGDLRPPMSATVIHQVVRDPAVRAWVLARANGVCESCFSGAPFIDRYGLPFLEVHHIKRLADGGPDTPLNAAGLCPNCHRRLHCGSDSDELSERLIRHVTDREGKLGDRIVVPAARDSRE